MSEAIVFLIGAFTGIILVSRFTKSELDKAEQSELEYQEPSDESYPEQREIHNKRTKADRKATEDIRNN